MFAGSATLPAMPSMKIVRGLDALPLTEEPSVVTVGFFDGVHLGHRAVVERTVQRARDRGVRSVAVTFDRHPREILTPGSEPRLLTSVERKATLIAEAGVDVLVVLGFTSAFSRVSAEAFVRDVLVRDLHAVHAVMGANFTFGFKAAGTIDTLPHLGAPYGLTAEGVDLLRREGRTISSTSVRDALAAGDLEWPLVALGRRFVLDGAVVSGHGRGKGLGFPTANLRTWPRLLLPGQGIYAGVAEHEGRRYRAAIDVGTNPTFGVEALHVESFLLDFAGDDLTGTPLAVEFWARLREEVRYASVDELVAAISADVARTRSLVPEAELG
jgi:riboflavin kinase/FMN adenylyltransferase